MAYCSKQLVTIACHATFTEYVKAKGWKNIKVHTIMMDECHFLDPRSIAARGIMDHMNEMCELKCHSTEWHREVKFVSY